MKKIYKAIEFVGVVWTFITIIWVSLQFFGLAPAEISFISKDDINPIIHLYPGNNVQLKPEFLKPQSQGRVLDVKWTIIGKNKSSEVTGLEPVITLPPEGGIYTLKAEAKIRDSKDIHGSTSFYIVQMTPQKVTANEDIKVKINSAYIADQSIEIYKGDGKSEPASVETKDGMAYVKFHKGQEIPVINGKVFYQANKIPSANGILPEYKTFDLKDDESTQPKTKSPN